MIEFQHPTLMAYRDEWDRFRLAYEGGRQFIDKYLKRYSVREDNTTFTDRKDITYCPGFAAAAVDEVNNTIFTRMPDVTRVSKSKSYTEAIQGFVNGVDYLGSSIDAFIGCNVLTELTVMGRVGVYVDMPKNPPKVGTGISVHPYYYVYRVEDIISWVDGKPGSGHRFTKLLLRDNFFKNDDKFGLVNDTEDKYRFLEVVDNGVKVTFLDSSKEILSETTLKLKRIPFVMLKLKHSLMKNVADYQIALLNMESTDVDFARKANFPIYTEQGSLLNSLPGNKPEGQADEDAGDEEPQSGQHVRDTGTQHGIRYARNSDRPDFIHPSAEPLMANMKKEESMKEDIRRLVHLNVSSLGTQAESRESKDFDRQGLENGLSLIALVLEGAERQLGSFWGEYESIDKEVTVSYPRNFDLRTEDDRRRDAEKQIALSKEVVSDTFQREMLKRVVNTLMSTRVSPEVLEKMKEEIDLAPSLTSDPKTVVNDLEAGLVTAKTASRVRGYKEGEAEKAQKEKAERMAEIAQTQGNQVSAARGTPDFGENGQASSADEKAGKEKRGEGKLDG